MAESKKTHIFLLYAPDYTDADAFNRRLAVRPQHLENSKLVVQQGILSTLYVLFES